MNKRLAAGFGVVGVAGVGLLGGGAGAGDSLSVDVRTVAVKGSDTPRVVAKAVIPVPPEKLWKKQAESCRLIFQPSFSHRLQLLRPFEMAAEA